MAESIYDKLRRTMTENLASLSRTSSDAQTLFTETNNRDAIELRSLFEQMITDRDALFAEFDSLIESKNKIYQTMLSIYFALIYFSEIKKNITSFNMILELFNIYNSSEFAEKIYSFLQYVYNENFSDTQTEDYQTYFRSRYDSIKSIFYPDREVVLESPANTISIYYTYISKTEKVDPAIGDRFLDLTTGSEKVYTAITAGTWIDATDKEVGIYSSIDSNPDSIPELGDLAFDISRNILYEATTNGTWLNAKKEVIESSIDSSENPEYYLLFALNYFGEERSSTDLNFATIDIYTKYLTTSNINMTSILFENAGIYMQNIRNYCRSFVYIEDQREEKDSAYSDEYIKEIYEKFGGYSELVNISTVITKETIETIKENGTYNTILLEMVNIETLLISLIDNVFVSLETLNEYIEKYAVFLKLPENSAATLENTITEIIPSISESIPEDIDFEFIDYLSVVPFSIDGWIEDILENNVIFRDNYTLILLFLGQFLRSSLAGSFLDNRFSNYALLKIVNYRNIYDIETNIDEDYYINSNSESIKNKESLLAVKYQIKVLSNPNNEVISSALKSIIPELSQIDGLDFRDLFDLTDELTLLNWWDGLSETSDLNNLIYLIILKSLLRNKNDFVKKVRLILIGSVIENGLNLKDIYIRNILKKVLQNIFSNLSTASLISYFNNDEISKIDSYTTVTQLSLDLINDYKLVWQTFYKSDADLFEDMLLNGTGTLKDFLENEIV